MGHKVDPRLRKLVRRGRREPGFTQPRTRLIAHLCMWLTSCIVGLNKGPVFPSRMESWKVSKCHYENLGLGAMGPPKALRADELAQGNARLSPLLSPLHFPCLSCQAAAAGEKSAPGREGKILRKLGFLC